MSDAVREMSDELKLLLTVARILRARIPEMAIAYQAEDIDGLERESRTLGKHRHGVTPKC